jgi:trigger factor
METDGLSRQIIKRGLLDNLAEVCTFEVPEGMVKVEFNQIWDRIKMDAIQSGQAQETDFEGKDGPDDENERKDFEYIAERRVRLGLLLAEVGKKNDIQIAQEEVNRALMQEAQRYPGEEKKVLDYFKDNDGAMDQLRAPLYEEKVCDFILGVASVTEKKVTRKQLEETLKALENSDEEITSNAKGKKPTKSKTKLVVNKKKPEKKEPTKKNSTSKKLISKKATTKKTNI